jgi:hypothetical protein
MSAQGGHGMSEKDDFAEAVRLMVEAPLPGFRAAAEKAGAGTKPQRKPTKKAGPFAQVPLEWMAEATKASQSAAALVCVYLLYLSWKTRSATVSLPNGWLNQHGVSPKVKGRVLRDLEAACLIAVERPRRKSPLVTLIGL